MKRIWAMLMVVMTLATTFLSTGCAMTTRGSDYCYRFLDYINAGEFDKAYEMLADSIKAPETEEERAQRLERETEEKEAKRQFWRELFGFDKPDEDGDDADSDATPDPAATDGLDSSASPDATDGGDATTSPDAADTAAPSDDPSASPDGTGEPSPTPNPDDTPEPTLAPKMENGFTPNPETGEYPDVTATPTPDPALTPSPALATEPGATPDPASATPTPRLRLFGRTTPTPTPSPSGDDPDIVKTITKVGFVEKYTSIFDELQLTGIEYTTTDVLDGEIVAKVDYSLTYHSERGGDLTYDFEIVANRIEHRWTIEWSPKLIFPMMEWGDNLRVGVLQANRGEILCDGEPYAQNVKTITVFAVPSTIPDVETFVNTVAATPEMEMNEEAVRTALSKQRNDFCKLQTFFPDEFTLDLEQRLLSIEGLAIDTANYGTLRYYPHGESLCHVVGYAGIITLKEKLYYERIGDTRYNGDSWIGKYGLEYVYEDTLLGTNGRFTYIQDAEGGSRGMLYKTDAIDGKDLHLTVKPELQERLEAVVDTAVYDDSIHGAVVVMNPLTGAIQAMISFPGFDLNYVARGMPEEEWEALRQHEDIPLYNRATQGLYTPGSVFKLMTSAALLETNTLNAGDVFPGSEEIDVDAWFPSEAFLASLQDRKSPDSWNEQSGGTARPLRRTHSDSRPSPMNMLNSVISSDNLYFAYGAMRMGWTKYEAYMEKVGWTTPIRLEVQEGTLDENTGLPLQLEVSTPQLYDKTKAQNDYDLAVTGYGQGQIMMSPLHMACFASAYANNGTIMQPYLVDSVWHASGTDYSLVEQRTPQIYRKQVFQQSTIDTLYPALLKVCTDGTARYMTKSFITRNPLTVGYTFAGKTGTAEITNDKTRELAWFVCWRDSLDGVPVTEENARLVCVMLEVKLPMGQEWSQMKYDIARALLKEDVLND